MKTFLILYNQINLDYFDISLSNNFLYIHHNGKIKFNGEDLNFNQKSKILDYSLGHNFIEELNKKGFIGDFLVGKNYFDTIKNYCNKNNIDEIFLVKPVENYVYGNFLKIQKKLSDIDIKLTFLEDKRSFFISHDEFLDHYKKPPIMETFYRMMRKKFDILMEGEKPLGEKWNFDKQNRGFDKNHKSSFNFSFDENNGLKEAKKNYNTDEKINYPTNREQALKLLNYFVKNHLDNFGKLEDAMYQNDDFVHHSTISSAINFGLLSPEEVVKIIEKQDTELNNKEGFIRQVLGWREYMYHFFQFYKGDIYKNNFFKHKNNLPEYFWGKNMDTCKMNCVKTSISRVLKNNYGHHIERLMIIGNFTLLSEINPLEVNKWFFEEYVDAFEWVVTPNVMGMSQFSDGGRLATKPYVSSGNYINKMSDFCTNCQYNVKTKYETDSCPFNYLYWDFVDNNKEIFKKTRQPFVVKNLEKVDIEVIKKLKREFNN